MKYQQIAYSARSVSCYDFGMEGYMTVAQAAERLGITPARVGQYINRGSLPAQRFGHVWAIKLEDLEAFAEVPRLVGWKKGRPRKPPQPPE